MIALVERIGHFGTAVAHVFRPAWPIGDLAALAAVFLVCTALSAKVFRWE